VRARVSLGILLILLVICARTTVAGAHGIGKPQVLNAASGPYLISAWTDPDPLRADETHVVVAVTDPATREPIVTGVEVTVRMQSVADPTTVITQTAGKDETNLLLFAAEFNGRVTEGRWRIGIAVRGERGAGEEVTFEVDVTPARGFNMLWVGLGGLVILVMGWVFLSSRSRPASPPPRRSRPTQSG
jgi:hypothetical protein